MFEPNGTNEKQGQNKETNGHVRNLTGVSTQNTKTKSTLMSKRSS